ncbi:hypothetical protein BaRGS_00032146 [Batillaria attramentaria]|uniref:ATP-binding cassette sub-family B member 6 n=1 Tax=Batillaria attramentaria TaxID=370345 RepID=A0ABD0JNJ4_9CAEN
MLFCRNGTEWAPAWQNNGINRCFFDSVSSSAMFLTIFGFGTAQCIIFSQHGSRTHRAPARPWAVLAQTLLTVLLILECVVHMIVQDLYLYGGLCGSEVLTMFLLTFAYLFSLLLLRQERNSTLPSLPTRHHGIALLGFWSLGLVRENLAFVSWNSTAWWWHLESTPHWVEFGLWLLRYAALFTLLLLGFVGKGLPAERRAGSRQLYDVLNGHSEEEEQGTRAKRPPKERSTWANIGQKLKIMLPIVWPSGSRTLQFAVVVCIVLLAGGRVVNVFVPIYSRDIVNSLTGSSTLQFRWDLILIYCSLLYLKGAGVAGGLLTQLRAQLWINVQLYSSKRMEVKVFTHLHSLSLRWHLQRKTGEVLRVVDRGTESMNTLLSQALFQILPTIIDCIIAIVYFVTAFNYLFGLIVFTCVAIYVVLTLIMMEWRTKYRREMNRMDNEANAQAVDSLLNFETVKYYGATEYEIQRYQDAITKYQAASWKSQTFIILWQGTQNTVMTLGYIAGLLLCAWAVVHGIGETHLTVGDYVLFGTYLGQLFGPLNSLGGYYRTIQKSFIDMENMFELLDKDPEVKDAPGATDLVVRQGRIDFNNVCFSYEPSRPILKNITFTVMPGETFALVGHTGCGKSTIIRLLFRFYDVCSGKIQIDGQNIAMVTQNSLRSSIGVVPQDTVLFNRDIRYNIRYGRVNATDAETEEAAAAAEIHNRIRTFPNQYNTVVGERGLKLSGGEKQRVAIARTLLKAPAIVLLDEATSALDTKTERNIQASLSRVWEIIEQGTHEELLALDGHYTSMWQQQLSGADNTDSETDNS